MVCAPLLLLSSTAQKKSIGRSPTSILQLITVTWYVVIIYVLDYPCTAPNAESFTGKRGLDGNDLLHE